MNLRSWLGLLVLVVWVGTSYLRVRARRRSGAVSNNGHPSLDGFLLFVSGLLLTAVVILTLLPSQGNRLGPFGERIFFYSVLLLVGGALTWFGNKILRHFGKK